jgi:PAS domain-containing protein
MGMVRRPSGEYEVPSTTGDPAEALRRLADAGQLLERVESTGAVADALPSIALALVRADGALLVRVEGSSLVRMTSRGVRLEVGAPLWLEGVLGAAWSGQPKFLASGGSRVGTPTRPGVQPPPPSSRSPGRDVPGRALLVSIVGAPEPWVLVVGRVGPGEVFMAGDLAPLQVVRALAEQALGRVRAMAALGEVVARESALLEASSEAMLVIDANGLIRAVSTVAADRFAFGRERAIGRRLADVAPLAPLSDVVATSAARSGVPVVLQGTAMVASVAPFEGGFVVRVRPAHEEALVGGATAPERLLDDGAPEPRVPTWDEMERVVIRQALRQHGGSVARAAKALGVAKGTVYNKMRRYGIDLPTGAPARGGVDDPTGAL